MQKPNDKKVKVTMGSGKNTRCFAIPASREPELIKFLSSLSKPLSVKTFSAEDVLPELGNDIQRPATMLRGARHKAHMTQDELARNLGEVRQHHLSEMENGKRPIGRDMAKRLAVVLKCDYRIFL